MDNLNAEQALAAEELPQVKVVATLAGKINLADFQNAVPAIRDLTVLNDTKADYQNLRLVAMSEPAFLLKSKTWHLTDLPRSRPSASLTSIFPWTIRCWSGSLKPRRR